MFKGRMGMLVKNQKILVVGAGKTGVAAAEVLHKLGAKVTVCDIKREYLISDTYQQLKNIPVEVISGGYPEVDRKNTDLVIMSPGVPLNIPPAEKALQLGIPVWSEMELAGRMFDAPVIAVTGTNGKTTTTALLGEMFKDAGMPTIVAGNIGIPLIGEAHRITPEHIVVAEVSSFQLECIHTFRPKVGIVINLTPDHLDRHRTMEEYRAAKERLFLNQGPGDYSILNYDDAFVRSMSEATKGEVLFFSLRHTLEKGAFLSGRELYFSYRGEKIHICSRDDLFIKGDHNIENALAACCAAFLMGLEGDSLRNTLKTFKGVKHRLQFVEEIKGVKYINDSKGTNPDASMKALNAYDQPIILIAGGKNKGSDFLEFATAVKSKVREVVLLGEAAPEIERALKAVDYYRFSKVDTLEEAVAKSSRIALPGEIVLLSPACASWDMFNSYEERGDLFIKQVQLMHSLKR